MNSKNIEVGVVKSDKVFRRLTIAQIKDYLEEVEWLILCSLSLIK